eukprot:9469813-Pyramimonas_sp.AAC.3
MSALVLNFVCGNFGGAIRVLPALRCAVLILLQELAVEAEKEQRTMFGGDSTAHKKDIDRVRHTYKARFEDCEN